MSSEESWRLLQHVTESIKFADTKAGAVLAGSGVLGGVLVTAAPTGHDFEAYPVPAVLTVLAIVCVGASALLSLLVLAPRLRAGEPRSLIYFDHIARRNRDAFVDNYRTLVEREDDLIRQVADQIWANSQVARLKFRRVAVAVWSLGAGMVLAGAAAVAQQLWG